MLVGRTEQFKQNFMVTHFFNPPRYMKLLELVAGPETSAEAKARVEAWGKDVLGKGIVWAKDTPNFVGNRIGVQSMMTVDPHDDGDGPLARGRRRDHRPADGAPEERDVPHRRHGRPRHDGPRRDEQLQDARRRRGPRDVQAARVGRER